MEGTGEEQIADLLRPALRDGIEHVGEMRPGPVTEQSFDAVTDRQMNAHEEHNKGNPK